MDWVFTPNSSWDLTELDINDLDLLETNQTMDDFSIFDISDTILNELSEHKHSTMSSPPYNSPKKPRTESSNQRVSCLVDGCKANLSGCRDYHRRHRVCETHSKTPVVTIGGKNRRFCQQCSRFHSLREFDDEKRSCRKRLHGHNRRRRKARPESMYFNYESFLTNNQGTKLLHFGGSPAYTTTTTLGGSRDKEKLNPKFQFTVEQKQPSNSYNHFRNVKQRRFRFPFQLDVDSDKVNQRFPEPSSFQQVVNTNAPSSRLLVEPQGVLYLLSSSNHTVHHASMSGQTNNPVQCNGSLSQPSGSHLPLQNVTEPDNGHTSNQLVGMIHFQTEGLLENVASQILSFSWD